MDTIKEIEARREAILEEMRSIRSMERGTISEYYVPVRHKGKKEPVLRGPYYVISRRGDKKTEGYHLKTAQELERARRDVDAHRRFRELCREYEELTGRLGMLERRLGDDSRGKKTAGVAVESDSEVRRFLERASSEHGVDSERGKCHHRPALLSPLRPDGRLLGTTSILKTHHYVADPRNFS